MSKTPSERKKGPAKKAPPAPEKDRRRPVVLLHGLSVPRLVLWRLGRILEKKYGRRVYNFPYNSRSFEIPAIAEQLSTWLAAKKIREFDAVAHSMGAIVLRWAVNHQPMPRLRRAVLLGPPNQGAWLASWLTDKAPRFNRFIHGEAIFQLRDGCRGLVDQAGELPGVEVGIIAGGSGTRQGLRRWTRIPIPDDHDGIVRVDETILPGMKDFLMLRSTHGGMLLNGQTAHLANLFLEYGVFRPKLAGLLRAEAKPEEKLVQ